MAVIKELLSEPTLSEKVKGAEDKQRQLLWDNIGAGLLDWAVNAKENTAKIQEAKADLETKKYLANPEMYGEQTDDVSSPSVEDLSQGKIMTPELQQAFEASDALGQAQEEFMNETYAPAAVGGAILAGAVPGGQVISAALMMPLYYQMGKDNIEKYGLAEGMKQSAMEFIPGKGLYDYVNAEGDLAKAKEELPLRTFLTTAAMDLADVATIAPSIKKITYDRMRAEHPNATEAEIRTKVVEELSYDPAEPPKAEETTKTDTSQPKEEPKVDTTTPIELIDLPKPEMPKPSKPKKTRGKNIEKATKITPPFDPRSPIVEEAPAPTIEETPTVVEPPKPSKPKRKRGRNMSKAEDMMCEMSPGAEPEASQRIDEIVSEAVAKSDEKKWTETEGKLLSADGGFPKRTSVHGEAVEVSPSTIDHLVTDNDVVAAAQEIATVRSQHIEKETANGYFHRISKIIKTRKHKDFEVLAHELGHYIDDIVKFVGCDDELINAAKSKWKHGEYGESPIVWRGEGIAEFFRTYAISPVQARKDFPQFFQVFTEAMVEHPELHKLWDNYCDHYRKWADQDINSPELAVRASNEVVGDVKKLILQQIGASMDTLTKHLVDEYAPVNDKVTKFLKEAGIELKAELNPAQYMQCLKSFIPARLALLLGNAEGISSKYAMKALSEVYGGIHLNEVTFADVMQPLVDGFKAGKFDEYLEKLGKGKDGKPLDAYEMFSTFVNAFNQEEIINQKNSEKIAEHKTVMAKNIKEIEDISNTYSKEAEKIVRKQGAIARKMANIDTKAFTKQVEAIKKNMDEAKKELMNKYTSERLKIQEDIKKVTKNNKAEKARLEDYLKRKDKQIADTEARYKARIESFEAKIDTIVGKLLTAKSPDKIADLNRRQAKFTDRLAELKEEMDVVLDVRHEEREGMKTKITENTLKKNKEDTKRIGKRYDRERSELDALIDKHIAKEIKIIEDMYSKALSNHTADLQSILKSYAKDLDKLVKKHQDDKRIKQLIEDTYKRDAIVKEIEEGRADYLTPNERQQVQAVLANAPEEFMQAAERMRQYNENLLNLAVYYGFIDEKTAKAFMENRPHYAPMNRSFSLDNPDYQQVVSFFDSLSKEGSDRTVLDPIMSMQKRAATLIARGERNMVKKAWAKMADELTDSSKLVVSFEGEVTNAQAQSVFTVYENGKTKHYQATDAIVWDAVNNMESTISAATANILTDIMEASAATLRTGTTQTPAFITKNTFVDTFMAGINHQTKRIVMPVIDTFMGIYKAYDKKYEEQYAQMYAQGVPFATRLASDKKTTRNWRDQMSHSPSLRGRAWNNRKWKKVADSYFRFGDMVEQAPRFQEFLAAQKEGKSNFEAGMMARDVTTDFSRSGTLGRQINRVTPFVNARIQGLNTYWRALKRDPKGTIAKSMIYITLPTFACWLMNKDEQWYKELSAEDKGRYYYINTGAGIIKLPRPDGVPGDLFGAIPEAILNYTYANDPRAIKDLKLANMIKNNLNPLDYPTALIPLIENGMNKDFFKDRDIVPPHLLEEAPPLQFNMYTSEFSKKLGMMTNSSPMLIDNAIKDVTGSMGVTALALSDSLFKDDITPYKHPIEYSRFVHTPGTRNRVRDVFYSRLAELKEGASMAKYNKVKYEHQKELDDMMKVANQMKKGSIKTRLQKTLVDEKMDTKVKRTKVDDYNRQLDDKMRNVLSQYGYKYLDKQKGD